MTKETMIKQYDKLIRKFVNNNYNNVAKDQYDDLYNDAIVILFEAYEDFDESRGVKFITFLYTRLKRLLYEDCMKKYQPICHNSYAIKKTLRLEKENNLKFQNNEKIECINIVPKVTYDDNLEERFGKYSMNYIETLDIIKGILNKYEYDIFYKYYIERLYEKDIAKIYNVDRSTISRHLTSVISKIKSNNEILNLKEEWIYLEN